MTGSDDPSTHDRTDDPFAPARRDTDSGRTIDWAAVSHAFVPTALRTRAIGVQVTTTQPTYTRGEPVDITIEFYNRLPIPIRLWTASPERWRWHVDDVLRASHVHPPVPDRPAVFSFGRNERKRFRREWHQRTRVADDEWEPIDPGTYTVGVAVNRTDAADRGLADRTTIEITL